MSKLETLAAEAKLELDTLHIHTPFIIEDFIAGEDVDKTILCQMLNRVNLEHNLKLGK